MTSVIAVASATLLGFGLITQGGHAYRWNITPQSNQVGYHINQSSEPFGGASTSVQNALSTWNTVNPSIFAYSYQGTSSNQGFQGNYSSDVSYNDPFGDLGSGVLAATVPFTAGTHSFDGNVYNTIVDMDIVFNNGVNFVTNASISGGCNNGFSIEAVALHESGHGFGLDHPDQVDPNYTGGYGGAVMYSAIAPCDNTKSTLRPDDRNGINFLYAESVAAPVPDFSADITEGTRPVTVNFTNMTTGVVSQYTWDFGDGVLANDENPTHEYLYKGTYTITLTADGPGGSVQAVKTDFITVNPKGSGGGNDDPFGLGELGCQCAVQTAPQSRTGSALLGLGLAAFALILRRRRRE